MKKRPVFVHSRVLIALLLVVGACIDDSREPVGSDPAAVAGAADLKPDVGFEVANMDRSVDPRQDFYRYAAGGWLDRVEIPASETMASQIAELGAAIDRQLLAIIQSAANAEPGTTTGPQQQIGDFYASAMNLERLEELDMQPIEADLARIEAAASIEDLALLSADFRKELISAPLVDIVVSPDTKQSDVYALYVAASVGSLSRNEYLDEDAQSIRDLYLDLVTTLFTETGDDAAAARKSAETVLAIERSLAEGSLTPVERADPVATYHKMSLAEAQALVPSFPIATYLEGLGVTRPESVLVPAPRSLEKVEAILTERSLDDVKAIFRWKVLNFAAEALSQRFAEPNREFSRRHDGLEESPSRERQVTRNMRVLLAHPLSRVYVDEYSLPATRQAIEEMVGHIRAEFRARLEQNPWLSEATREAALGKLSKMTVEVGYPQEWVDYSDIVIERDAYADNVRRLFAFRTESELAKLGQPVKWESFHIPTKTTPVDVNAAYVRPINGIEISAAILQPPFYDPELDDAVNYCAIGAAIGHEFTHGFDSNGRLFDADGNLNDWWSPESTEQFVTRARRVIDQFNSYEILPGVNLNGQLTMGENIADMGGIRLAYNALQRSLDGEEPAEIDGLSAEERCFIGWAQVWMTKARPEELRKRAATDTHAASAFRASGPLVHMEEFYETFGIVEGDPMWRAPDDRIRIW